MRKLTLNIDSLTVQSFATGEDRADRGTVEAHQQSWNCTGTQPNCPSMYDATDCRVSDLGTCVPCGGGGTGTTCPTNGQDCWEDS